MRKEALKILSQGTAIPAIPLALDENRKFSERGQRLLTRYYLESGAGGIATAVHTTQFAIRRPEYGMFEPVLRTVAEEIDKFEARTGKTIVRVAGVCGLVNQAVSEAETAAKYGYDAVLLSPGGLNSLPETDLIERTAAVAKVLPVIGFYLQTACGGRIFSYDYWRRICDTPNVVAVKCASFNRYTTVDVARAAAFSERADEITLYTGNDDNIVDDLLTEYRFDDGGEQRTVRYRGGLLGHYSVNTRRSVLLYERLKFAADEGKITPDLLAIAPQVTDMNAALFDPSHGFAGCIAGLHLVLNRQGLMQNIFCLDPAETLSAGQKEEIDRVWRMYPQLCDDEFIAGNIDRWKRDL